MVEDWEYADINATYEYWYKMKREELIHRAIVDYLKVVGPIYRLWWAHVPNGGSRHPAEAANLKRMGVIAGVADLLIIPEGGKAHWLEVKSETGRQQPKQKAFEHAMTALGSPYEIVRSVTDAETVIKKWFGSR